VAGGAGYATAVVAAPTGVSATDTANIQNAINGLPAAGGLVILREGNYVLNASITLPAAKPVEIAGQGMSTKLSADATFAATFPAYFFVAPAAGNASQLSFRDFLVQDTTVAAGVSGNIRVFKFVPTGTQVFDHIELRNIQTIGVDMLIQANCVSGTKLTNVRIAKCRASATGTAWCLIHAGGALNVVKNIQIEGNAILTITGTSQAMSIGGEAFTVTNNRIDQPGGSEAISANGGLIKSVIANNNIKALVGNCIRLSSIGAQPSSDVIISGNDIEADPASTAGINLNDFVSSCVVIGNRINNKPITLTGTGGGGNLVIGNAASAVTDTMGGGNKIADTYITSIKKTGAADITGAATLTPGSGITLTQTGNDITIAAAGGGYATAVVAAPSGTAATDTTNIQTAINAVTAAGGGTVVLREGIYLISTTINPKSGVTIMGQGKSTGYNTGLSGTSGGGSPSGTTLRGTTGLGTTKMIADSGTAPINVTFRDLNLDFGLQTRGSIGSVQDMVMHGSNLTFRNVMFIGTCSVGNPAVDLTPTNTLDTGKNKFIGCDFYDGGTAATVCYQINGLITDCYFEGTSATFSESVAIVGGATITNCYFASNKNYNTGFVYVQPSNNATQPQMVVIANCIFKQYTTAQTTAIFVDNVTNGNVAIIGNVGDSASAAVGQIRCLTSAGLRNVTGNVGFTYNGGNQNANDGQTAINNGGAAGGDLSGTYPNPAVAKVNGTAVPASPTAGQVLTATGSTAATWQTPTPGGYATVVVAAPTGVAATDTANIQAALNSIPVLSGGGGGGVVILRQGIYVVNQITIFNEGTKLSGSGPGFTPHRDASPGSSLQAANPLSADMLVILASQVLVENISFKGFGLAAGFALVSGNLGNTIFRDCAFVGIKAGNIGIKATTGQDLKILDCMFQILEQSVITVARTPIAIKVGSAAFGFSQNVDIIGNHFMIVVEVSPTGAGSIVAKAIEMTQVFKAVIEGNQIEGNSSFSLVTGVTTIGVELFTNGSAESKGVAIGNNNGRSLNNFIRQTTGFPKVTVCGNNYIKHVGSAPVIDLVTGNTNWAIAGNVIEGATGVNLAAGADSNVVVGNIANVVNAGAGNSVVNNVAPL
jgi:hypothetical protein